MSEISCFTTSKIRFKNFNFIIFSIFFSTVLSKQTDTNAINLNSFSSGLLLHFQGTKQNPQSIPRFPIKKKKTLSKADEIFQSRSPSKIKHLIKKKILKKMINWCIFILNIGNNVKKSREKLREKISESNIPDVGVLERFCVGRDSGFCCVLDTCP